MSRLEKIQRISGVLRYLLIGISVVIGSALIIAMFTPGQDWVTLGDGRFAGLLQDGASNRLTVIAIFTPIAISLVLGVYWLQRLFGEYQAGRFFTDGCMRCYVWLVWLKVFSFLYGIIWPLLLMQGSTAEGATDVPVSIDAGTFIELIVLLLIVHLLKEAQRINDENKAII